MAAKPPERRVQVLRGLALLKALYDVRHDLLGTLLHTAQTSGDLAVFRLHQQTLAVANTAELAHEVLHQHAAAFEKAPNLTIAWRPVLGNGLLTSPNAFHRLERRVLAPAFHGQRVMSYAQTMARLAQYTQDAWQHGSVLDLHAEMMRLTLGIVGQTLLGTEVLSEANDVGEALSVVMHEIERAFQRYSSLVNTGQVPQSPRFRQAVTRLDGAVSSLIAAHRAAPDAYNDLVSLLLQAQHIDDTLMTDAQIRDEVMTTYLAGHETMANALTWTWYLLAQHPDAEAQLHGELDRVLGGRLPEAHDLAQLPYTLRVLKEALRLYPPAYMVLRLATHPVEIGGYRLPAGSLVVVSPYTLHRRPDYFPDPERFDPDRFLPAVEGRLPRYAYLPFGGGPRICIGNMFALTEGHTVLAVLAQRVRFALTDASPVEMEPLITLRPKHGLRVSVWRRTSEIT